METTPQELRAAADRLFASDLIDDRVREGATVGDPLPIRTLSGDPAGWFVPVIAGERLRGFIQFDASLAFLRFSRFPDPPPLAATWIDADAVREIARHYFPEADGTPFLTFDRNVSRLVWALPAGTKTIFVAGEYAWAG